METHTARIDDLVTKLRGRGLRLTPQRMAVLKTVIGSREHLSAEEIYTRVRADFPMIGLATVYKTIGVLKEMGEIAVLNFDNQRARYDGSGRDTHPHFICNRCNAIVDLKEEDLENIKQKIALKTGYQITDCRLDFFGICPNCQSQ
jgi:Fur family peroxide stress response transcriptional regulator